jgi:hypothetical protein
MSIIYIHGVNTRLAKHGVELGKPFLRWLGPKVSDAPHYVPVFWGDICEDQFRWKLKSRPETGLIGQGGETEPLNRLGAARAMTRTLALIESARPPAADDILLDSEPTEADENLLGLVPEEDRPDFVVDLYLAVRSADRDLAPDADIVVDDPEIAAIALVAEDVAEAWDDVLASATDDASRAEALVAEVDRQLSPLLAAGSGGDWLGAAGEILSRALHAPNDIVAAVVGEARPGLNRFAANFLGDVLTYLNGRETPDGSPGPIPQRVIAALIDAHERKQQSGEPIVVVTHSMGGQLFYDAMTYFAPRIDRLAGLEVDQWLSCGAQVSFFAELGLFKEQPATREPQKLPMPRGVKAWTNYFDHNDFVGFVMAPVFEGVEDISYGTGYGLAAAHSGYLARPSFFKALASALRLQ